MHVRALTYTNLAHTNLTHTKPRSGQAESQGIGVAIRGAGQVNSSSQASVLLRGNLVDLAVAVVIGAAFSDIVKALVRDLITPLIAAIGGKQDFSRLSFTIHNSRFAYGDFVNYLLGFVIVAAVIYYLVVLPVGKMLERFKPTPDSPPATSDCPNCLS
jgi:large conductance mechanosensitive channel